MPDSTDPTPLGPTPPLTPRPKIRLVVARQSSSITMASRDPLKAAITKANEASPLLALPTSIRAQIFNYVFTTHQAIELLTRHPRGPSLPSTTSLPHQNTTPTNPFAALLVCRHLYLATLLLPFARNTFHSSNTWDLGVCLARLRPAQRRAISVLLLRWFTADAILRDAKMVDVAVRPADAALRALPGLKRVVVDAQGESACTTARVAADLLGWLAERGRGDVKVVMGREDGDEDKKEKQGEGEFNVRFQRKWGPKNMPRKKPRLAAATRHSLLAASKTRDAQRTGAVPWNDHKGKYGRKQGE